MNQAPRAWRGTRIPKFDSFSGLQLSHKGPEPEGNEVSGGGLATSQLYFDTSSIVQPRRLYRLVPVP
jgi:hypothetical protein